MVSPLSSRILNAEAKANIKGGHNTCYRPLLSQSVMESWERQRKRGISGYSADRERDNASSPLSVQCSFQKRMRTNIVEAQAKRRRTEELNYQAYNVKNDLSTAGVSSLPFLGRQKALPPGSVDMSSVELIIATKDSPYYSNDYCAGDDRTEQGAGATFNQRQELDNFQNYTALLDSCQSFYTGKLPTPSGEAAFETQTSDSADSRNTGSSLSSINSEDDQDVVPLQLPAKLVEESDASVNSNCDDTAHQRDEKAALFDFVTSPVNLDKRALTLEEALITSNPARVVVEASKSMIVVHTTASFCRLTGVSSEHVVDDHLANLIQPDTSLQFSGLSFGSIVFVKKESQNTFNDNRAATHDMNNIWGGNKSASLVLSSYAIKSPGMNRITHYAIDFAIPNRSPSDFCNRVVG